MWQLVVLWVITTALSYYLQRKAATNQDGPKPGSIKAPTAEAGREIPVLFGTKEMEGPMIVWYGDLKTIAMDEHDVVIGYKYKVGIHFALCHGPIDNLTRIRVDKRVAWEGEITAEGTISIDKNGLFGGKKHEGGVKGNIDYCPGASTQSGQHLPDRATRDAAPGLPRDRGGRFEPMLHRHHALPETVGVQGAAHTHHRHRRRYPVVRRKGGDFLLCNRDRARDAGVAVQGPELHGHDRLQQPELRRQHMA